MNTVYKVAGIALVVGGLLLWMASALPSLPKFGIPDESSEVSIPRPIPAVDDGYVRLSGVVLYDEDREAPVPYIAYKLPNGGMRTKQLIFRNDHGCSPSAGDLPCATGEHTSFPMYPSGTPITVAGTILGDQIFVEQISA